MPSAASTVERNRLSDRAAARRAGQRDGRRAADAGDRAAGRRIPPRRAAGSGRGRAIRRPAAQFGGPDRDVAGARLYRSQGLAVGETTFMVEDYIPERIEFDVSAKEKMIKAETRLS